MSTRLNIWDFDDTLVWSNQAAVAYRHQNPDVDEWRLWHDPDVSSEMALEALPIISMWDRLQATPGTHWVLSGRTPYAIDTWLEMWAAHPRIGPLIRQLGRVGSTSDSTGPVPDTHTRKVEWVRQHVQGWGEVHFYDNSYKNITAMRELGWVQCHYVQNGRVVTGSAQSVDKTLQHIYHTSKALLDLKSVSTQATYTEIFKGTLGILRSMQNDLLSKQPTAELLHLVGLQLKRRGMDLEGDLWSAGARIDRGAPAFLTVRVDGKLAGVVKMPARAINRHLHTLQVEIEYAFDQLSMPLVGRVVDVVRDKGVIVGFQVKAWKIGGNDV